MKIAISTLPFQTWELEEILQYCKNAGYNALELRMDFHKWSDTALPNNHYINVRKKVEEEGICISNLGSGIVLGSDNDEDLKKLERLFEIAGFLNTKGVRIMLGHIRLKRSELELPLDNNGILSWLKKADILAAKYQKEVWIETHNEFSTGHSLECIFQKILLPNTKVIWDIMHPLEKGENIGTTIHCLKNYLAHVHIKDGMPWNNQELLIWKYTRLGEGIIPIEEIVTELCHIGYEGYFSLEWESAWRNELTTLNCDGEEILKFPKYLMKICEEQK